MKAWSEIKEEFGVDGSLRDIYVEEIDPALWKIFIEAVRSSVYKHEFTHGGVIIGFPDDLPEIKRLQETNPTTLAIWLNDKVQVNCHFFVETEIELDISPRDIVGEHEYQVLTSFLEWISSILKKRVILTHENTQDQVILSVG
ncbi:MAG: protein export chaperone SecB [Agarilytica sp.]